MKLSFERYVNEALVPSLVGHDKPTALLLTCMDYRYAHQGQRTLNSFDTRDLHQEVVIPAAELAFHCEAFFARVLLQE